MQNDKNVEGDDGLYYSVSTAAKRRLFGNVLFSLFLLLFPISGAVAAEYRFVYPDINIPLRRGVGEKYKIIKMLKDGERVELLEEKEGWAKVKLKNGLQGWMLKRLLTTSDVPSTERLEALKAENNQLREEIDSLSMKLEAMNNQELSVNDDLVKCYDKLNITQAKYDALKDLKIQFWFLIGIAVPLIAWLLGRISAGSRKKRSRLI